VIIAEKNQPVIKSGIGKESHFNIKDENVAHIFSILRNQLYSDKIGAVIREYITNAIDAHVEANVDRPISVTLPSIFSHEFVVRDYGKGLSPEDMVKIFASYGASTKRESNSFTGMLGIGSKSAFSYTNSFTIISRYEGTETVYTAYIDESNIGTIATIYSKPTNESGLSIHIATQKNDFEQFSKSIIQFFKYIDYRPEFLGAEIYIQEPKSLINGSSWKFFESSLRYYRQDREVHFVMGNVTYTSTYKTLSSQLQISLEWLESINNIDLVVDVPIGKIKPSASRESLEFNDLTKSYLFSALFDIKLELGKIIKEKFEECKSDYQRHCVAFELERSFSRLLLPNIKKYVLSIYGDFLSDKEEHIKIKDISRDFNYLMDKSSVYVAPNTRYIVHDSSQKITHIQHRVNEYFETLPSDIKKLVVLKFNTLEQMNNFKNHPSFQGADFVDAGTLTFQNKYKTALKSEEANIYQFNTGNRLNIESWNPSKSSPPSDAVYIEISSFKPKHYKENSCVNDVINNLRGAFGIKIPTIYGIKTADLEKTVQNTWIELKDYLIQQVNNWKKNNPEQVRDYEYFKDSNAFQKELIGDFEPWNHLAPNLEYYHRHQVNYWEAETALMHFNIPIFKYNPPKEFEALYERYPYMRAFQCTMSYSDKMRLVKYLDLS
jgi:hypothetical protein